MNEQKNACSLLVNEICCTGNYMPSFKSLCLKGVHMGGGMCESQRILGAGSLLPLGLRQCLLFTTVYSRLAGLMVLGIF